MAATVAAAGIAAAGSAYASNKSAGASKAAAKSQSKQNLAERQFLEGQVQQAREDAIPLYGSAIENRLSGQQRQADLLAGSLPQQFSLYGQGMQGAQEQIAGGLPQIQNAIMGSPVDFSAFQPSAPPQVDLSSLLSGVNSFFAGAQTPSQDVAFGQGNLPPGVSGSDTVPIEIPGMGIVQIPRSDLQLGAGQSGVQGPLNTGLPQTPEQQRMQGVQGLSSDADLFRLAGMGQIGNFSAKDQDFFRRHYEGLVGSGGGTERFFVDNPQEAMEYVRGLSDIEYTPQNRQRTSTLLNEYSKLLGGA